MSLNQPVKKQTDLKVIALAMICVILASGLVAAILVGQQSSTSTSDLQAQLSQKDSTISSLQSQITQLQSQLAQAQAQASSSSTSDAEVASLEQQISDLTAEIKSYVNMLNLNASSTLYSQQLTQDANSSTVIFQDTVYYAGYVVVSVSATANSTYAQVGYTFGTIVFNYNQTVGTSGTAYFAVLPGTLQVSIGNINETDVNNVNATAVYCY